MSVRVACPHCNAVVTVGPVPASGRAACPRCGELFPVKHAEPVDDEASGGRQPLVEGFHQQRGADAPRSPRPFPSRSALFISFALAAAVLAAGVLILRPWDRTPPTAADSRPPGTAPPPALDGLRYLPPTANVVFAVQPAPLLAYAERTHADPKDLLARAGVPAEVTGVLDRLGLPLDQIDHVVVGLSLTNQAIPGVAAVLKLRRPVADEDEFLRRLRAEKKPIAGRPVYTVSAGAPLLLTRVDDRTYLFGLTDTDLKAADAPHPPDGLHLPRELRESLAARLSPASFVWAATDADRWADKPVLKLVLKKEQLAKLAQGRAAAIGLALEPDPALRAAVRLADAAAAAGVRQVLRDKLGEKAIVGGEDDWATAEVPIDFKDSRDVVRKLFP